MQISAGWKLDGILLASVLNHVFLLKFSQIVCINISFCKQGDAVLCMCANDANFFHSYIMAKLSKLFVSGCLKALLENGCDFYLFRQGDAILGGCAVLSITPALAYVAL